MNTLLASLLSFLLLYKYFALFIVTFLAAVALPLPVNSLLFAAGVFASQGYFSFAFSLMVALMANMLGDSFGYFLAKRYGRAALSMLHIRIPKHIGKLERYALKHPGPTVFFTRFFGTIDPLTNILSGFVRMPFAVFIFYDLLGNAISIGGILYSGYFVDDNWENFSKFTNVPNSIFFILATVLIIGGILWQRRNVFSENPKQNDKLS